MGNLIKDFWRYPYTRKKDNKTSEYFGRTDTIAGEDLSKKNENFIETALRYTMRYKILSHMSIQTFTKSLKDAPDRTDTEQKYYPMVCEFEPIGDATYKDAVKDAVKYVQYCEERLCINEKDILTMVNNNKSIYVFINPKVMGVTPEVHQSKIYYEIYKEIKRETGIKNVDESIVKSNYKLMKTPNTFYMGGYFVRISREELNKLSNGTMQKEQLTKERRTLDIEIPAIASTKAIQAYKQAKQMVKESINNNKGVKQEKEGCTSCKGCGKCVEYIMTTMQDKGARNYLLVSLALAFKERLQYTQEDTVNNVVEFAKSWMHDENARKVAAKVKWAYRNNKHFSCNEVRRILIDESGVDMARMCSNCAYASKKGALTQETINIDRTIINALWDSKGSVRHYQLYLELVQRGLINKKFNVEKEKINERTLKEFCKKAGLVLVLGTDGEMRIVNEEKGAIYRLPVNFIQESMRELGEYVKHYLRLFVKGYKAADKYMLLRVSKAKLSKHLGYKNITSLYKLIVKLEDIGLIKEHRNSSSISLYYTSYKVVELYPSVETNVETNEDFREEKVAVGQQIFMEDIKKKSKNENENSNKNKQKDTKSREIIYQEIEMESTDNSDKCKENNVIQIRKNKNSMQQELVTKFEIELGYKDTEIEIRRRANKLIKNLEGLNLGRTMVEENIKLKGLEQFRTYILDSVLGKRG